jgi:transposase
VLRHPYRRGKADLDVRAAGLPAGQDDQDEPAAWMGFDLLEGAYDTRQFIRVLDGLGHQLDHQPVTVIWDNLGAHHAGDLHAWAATQPWLELAYLLSYAPELDPVEGLWANLKGCELANRCCADRAELIATAQVGSIRVRRDPELLRGFLAGTGLTL